VEAFEQVEQGLNVIGATAVEDKLQVGVKETIEKLRMAGLSCGEQCVYCSELCTVVCCVYCSELCTVVCCVYCSELCAL